MAGFQVSINGRIWVSTEAPLHRHRSAAEVIFGVTPLHAAAWRNENPAVTEALLAAGADVNARSRDGYTPGILAELFNENPAVTGLLLEAEANPEARNEYGNTPLHLAANFRGGVSP